MSEEPKNSQEHPDRKKQSSQRNRTPPTSMLWYLVLLLIIGSVVASTMKPGSDETIKFGEFVSQLKSGMLSADQIHELTIGPTEMTWQSESAEYVQENGASRVEHFRVALWGQADESRKELEEVEEEWVAYDLFMQCMHSNGIPYQIIKQKLPLLNEEIAKILGNIVDFEVFFERAYRFI